MPAETVAYRLYTKPSPRASRDPRDCGLWRHAKRNEHRARVLGKSEWVGGKGGRPGRALKLL